MPTVLIAQSVIRAKGGNNTQLWMPKTRAVFYQPAVPIQTQGGIAGWQIPITVELGGFRTQ